MAASPNGTSPFLRTTFGIRSARDWYEKLAWEHRELESRGYMGDVELQYRAINFCVTAWSLVDWIWRALEANGLSDKVGAYRASVIRRSPALEMCRHVADATKHGGIDRSANEDLRTEVEFPFANFGFGRSEMSIALLCKEATEFLDGEMRTAGLLTDY